MLFIQFGDELLQQIGELNWRLLMRGVPGFDAAGQRADFAARDVFQQPGRSP
jgi:hypothetical protein